MRITRDPHGEWGYDTLHHSRGGPRVRIHRNAKLTPGGRAAMIERLNHLVLKATDPAAAAAFATEKMGFTLRVPCGLVAAITPFNYPLLLVAHKVGPALAAGNSVILKPARRGRKVVGVVAEVVYAPAAGDEEIGRGIDLLENLDEVRSLQGVGEAHLAIEDAARRLER